MSIIFHNLNNKINCDRRGWVANPFLIPDFPLEYGHLHTVSINAGVVRGNHFHRRCREWLFIFGGAHSVHWREGETVLSKYLESGEYYTIEIPPGLVHAVRNESDAVIYLLSYQDADRETVKADTEYSAII